MKQARQVARGARRRRGAKPHGRNPTREVEAHGNYVAPCGWHNVEGEQTSEGVAGSICGRELGDGSTTVAHGSNSEEEPKPVRGSPATSKRCGGATG
jgi:hypothetical protein